MKNKYPTFGEIVETLKNNDVWEIGNGVYAQTSEYTLQEQESWPDEDVYKLEDFNTSPYWITTDNGAGIWSIGNETEYNEFVKENS
jgi:hypothetical protein